MVGAGQVGSDHASFFQQVREHTKNLEHDNYRHVLTLLQDCTL